MDKIRAWAWGLRNIAPYNIPGRRISAPYCARPVTLSVASWRCGFLPITRYSSFFSSTGTVVTRFAPELAPRPLQHGRYDRNRCSDIDFRPAILGFQIQLGSDSDPTKPLQPR